VNELVRSELSKVLEQWQAGTPVRSLAIGHRTRPKIDRATGHTVHELVDFRQLVALEFVFRLIDQILGLGEEPIEYPVFQEHAQAIARVLSLTPEEYGAAASLAWVALHRGWVRALEGHADRDYITVTRKADA
jgi:hypothetical protein